MIALHLLALNFDGVTEVAIRFIGAATIFSVAWGLTDRFGPLKPTSDAGGLGQNLNMNRPDFGDTVQIVSTPDTVDAGYAGQVGLLWRHHAVSDWCGGHRGDGQRRSAERRIRRWRVRLVRPLSGGLRGCECWSNRHHWRQALRSTSDRRVGRASRLKVMHYLPGAALVVALVLTASWSEWRTEALVRKWIDETQGM